MEIFDLLLKGANYWEHGGGLVESPRADVMEEKVKELVDRDIQKHGRSTILSLKSPNHIELPVTESDEEVTTEATPLIWAACLGRTSLVEFVVSRGADINATDIHNRTALIWAADRGDLATTLCLIKHGADLELKEENRYKSTALNWAAWRKHPSVVKALVEAGAVIDAPNRYGATALHFGLQVVNETSFEITQILLMAGAQLPKWTWKVLVEAWGEFNENHFSLVTLLVEYGLPVNETMKTFMGEEKANQIKDASGHKVPFTSNALFHFFLSGTDEKRSCRGEQPRNTKHC